MEARQGAPPAAPALLAACASGPRHVDATNPTVTCRLSGDYELDEAARLAADYCADFGRASRVLEVTRQGADEYATLECI